MGYKRLIKKLDYTLIITVILVLIFSLIIISSATHVTSTSGEQGDPYGYVTKQLIWIIMGIAVAIPIILVHYEVYLKYTRFLYIFNLIMLVSVLILGYTAMGAQRWIAIGPFIFQPSEFSKIIIIITFAAFLTEREGRLKRFRDLIPCFLFIGVPMLLTLIQPDLGTSLVFMAIMFGMLLAAGARPALILSIVGGGIVLISVWLWAHFNLGLWIPLEEYQLTRLTIFVDPWKDWQGAGYHMIQSQIAIGSGGLLGRGLFNGSQSQLNFLPIQHTDFIFSVVGEELGFIGAAGLLLMFFIIVYRGLRIASEAKDTFGTLLAVGIVSKLTFHILVNVGMTAGIMPVTGVPLPLFSYGGSSMLTNLMALAILLNVYVHRQKLMF
ncbi:rod shape-determining protein RodA [Desulfolucanica intricata]|uniref:rod shape-determining protein RodA n=1 Tax=Desulfolucanica intricata TaxID=1285191 RepID=UPI00083667E3|nr:rod shape-determining protein RodA [Desulfolucanica intricata]